MSELLARFELRQIYLLLGSVTFLSLTALVMFYAKPMYERYDATQWELLSLKEVQYSDAQATLTQIELEVAALEQVLLGDFQTIPTRQLEAHIIAALQDSAWRNEIELVSVEPLDQVVGMPYEEVSFRLEVEGPYFNLYDWIQGVGNQLGYVVFKEYALKVNREGKDPILNARLTLSAYRMEPVS